MRMRALWSLALAVALAAPALADPCYNGKSADRTMAQAMSCGGDEAATLIRSSWSEKKAMLRGL